MADINKEASWVTARLMEISNATQDGTNILITNANLGNFVPSDVVRTSAQTLTDAERQQARTNIGAASTSALNSAIVELDSELIALENGKVDKPEESTEGNVAIFGSNNNIIDGGFKATEAFPVGSASGSIVTIEDGADGVPIKTMTVQIEPIQAGTGDPSPSNVRAISGWTKAKVVRTAKNLVGGTKLLSNFPKYLPNVVIDDTLHTARFPANATAVFVYPYGGISQMPFKPNTKYTFIVTYEKSSGTGSNMVVNYTDGTYAWIPAVEGTNAKTTVVYVTTSGKTVKNWAKANSSGYTKVYCDECGVFEGVLTADDFVPYNGNTYTIEFPTEAGTVYGGELTVNEDGTGTLTVDSGTFVPTSSNMNRNSNTLFTSNAIADMLYTESTTRYGLFCNKLKSVAGNVSDDRCYLYQGRIYCRVATSCASVDDFLSTYSDLFFVYPLATPVVYQLTAPQVRTLLGLNNIWADTGDISVEYHADPTLYVEEKTTAIKKTIAYLQDDFTAIQPYVVNDLVYVGDTLYIVTSAIAQGATMTPNTNCSETTLNAVIKSLR